MSNCNENKINLILLIFLGILLWILPFGVNAAGEPYEVGVKFYELGANWNLDDTELWYEDFVAGDISELSDTVLQPGTTFVVGLTLKTVDTTNANATAFALYIGYDTSLLEVPNAKPTGWVDERRVAKGGIFPSSAWEKMVLNSTTVPGQLIASFGDSNTALSDKQPFVNTEEGPAAFFFLKVKDDAKAGETITFDWITEDDKPIDGLYTMGSTADAVEVAVKTNNSSVLSVYEEEVVIDATLSELTVKDDTTNYVLDPEFQAGSGGNTYNVIVAPTVEKVTIAATATAGDAAEFSGTGLGEKTLSVGENTYEFMVTVKEDGTVEVYTVIVTKLSGVATLEDLSLSNATLNETFESTNLKYTANVSYQTKETEVSATATSPATIKSGTGTVSLVVGDTPISVVVEAENCDAKYVDVPNNVCDPQTYEITVTRSEPSTVATLKKLIVNDTEITLVDGDYDYEIDAVGSGVDSVGVVAETTHDYAKAVTTGNTGLVVGENTIEITVTAEDDKATQKYTVKVVKKSNDATLKELHVTSDPQGTLDKDFNANTTVYIYYYDETVKTVHVEGVANSSTIQSITPAADYTIGEDTEAKIVVVPEDGAEKTYTIRFERKKSTVSTLDSLTVKNGEIEYGVTLESGKFEYTVTVPHEVDKVQISGETTSDNVTKVTGFEEISLGFTEVEHKVVVIAEDEDVKTEYVIKITREMSDNAYLKDIKIGGFSIAGFVKENLTYTLKDVSSGTAKLDITYTKDNDYSTVTIEDNTLVEGQDNVVKIKVKSQDETVEKEYLLTVRRQSSDATLKGITVTSDPQGYLDKDFSADTTIYTYYYDRTVKKINVSVEKSDAVAKVIGEGDYTVGEATKAEIVVTPEDGTINTYVVNFVQILEEDSTLKSLTVTNGGNVYGVTLESGKLEYTVSVPTEVDKITIDAEANGSFVTSVTGLVTDAALAYGDNVFEVVVTAEDESKTSTYTITINRAVSKDASLINLLVDNNQVPDFKPEVLNYTLDAVAYTKDKVTITATGVDGTTIEGDGVRSLAVGNNTLDVVVTAADGDTKVTYKINIYRKSKDATLTGLTVTSGTLEPNFAAGTKEYTLTIPADVETITINPTPATGAKITNLADLSNISVNGLTEVKVEVEAEDSNYTDTYVIKINQLASSNNNLKSLVVKDDDNVYGVTLESGTFRYTINVDKDVDFVYIEAEKEHSDAEVDGHIGRQDLDYGENVFTITVTAEDTTPQDYTVVINRAKNNDNSITSLKIFGQTATWDATNNKYVVIVDNANAVLTADDIDAKLPEGATIDKGAGMTLVEGINTYTVMVEAQDGTKATYTIEIFRKGSVTELLTNLTIYGKTPTWNASLSQYELTVENATTTLAPTDIEATVPTGATLNKGTGKNLVVGANPYVISVTLADGTVETYNIAITRRGSSANTLSGLTIYGETPTWNASLSQYELTVENSVETLEPTDIEATVPTGATLNKGDGKDLVVGANEYEISVTAEDGTEAEYKIVITRKGLDIPATITSTQHTITDDYIMTVKELATGLELENQLDNENQYLEIWTADDARKVQDSEVLATGMIVKLKIDGVEHDRKYIVIKGDTDGNGEIDLFDAMKILNDYLNRVKLSGPYLEAGYVNEGTELDLFDAMGILNHYLGRVKLH